MSSEDGFRSNHLSTEVTIVWLFHSTKKKIVGKRSKSLSFYLFVRRRVYIYYKYDIISELFIDRLYKSYLLFTLVLNKKEVFFLTLLFLAATCQYNT